MDSNVNVKESLIMGEINEITKLGDELDSYLNDLQDGISRLGALLPEEGSEEKEYNAENVIGVLEGLRGRQQRAVAQAKYLVTCLNNLV